jgi:hypothetical protein
MPRAIVLLVTVGVAIYALVDCLRSRPEEIRLVPKLVWIVGIVLFPLFGAVVYLVFGRVGAGAAKVRDSGPRVIAPDDDPDFLRSLRDEQRKKARPKGTDKPTTPGEQPEPRIERDNDEPGSPS